MTERAEDADGSQTEKDPSIWELVPLADYRLPQTPAARAARARWASLKRLFGRHRHEDETPARTEADLRRLPTEQLDSIVAAIDWASGSKILQNAFETRSADDPVCFVVGPPGSGHVQLLRHWGTDQGARWITSPTYQDILKTRYTWLNEWPTDARCWVLPRLEHCWLRSAAGLALIRELLDRALAGRLGHGIIGCDSWTWAYLRYVAPLPTHSGLTLQAIDGERLAVLFGELVAIDGPRPVRFCNARTGKLILAVDGEDDVRDDTELQSLAARCRGSAGLARELWRARLRSEPAPKEGTDEDGAGEDAEPPVDGNDDGTTVWVAPPPEEPALLVDGDEELALVVHALLLHNGLPGPVLANLLPLPPFRVQASLQRLAAAGIAAAAPDGRWQIAAPGYPTARELLREQGLLLDDF